ncbi:MAG: CBS domain-containing protein [Nitrospiraceae bacterium]
MLKKARTMETFEIPGSPAGGIRTVGQIRGTNTLIFHTTQNGMAVAVELLSSHTPGAPVVDDQNRFVGFISEIAVLRALESGQDLSRLTAGNIMVHDQIAVTAETTLTDAVKMMEEKRVLNLPVKQNGMVAYSVTRHDLLRAWIGLGTTGED